MSLPSFKFTNFGAPTNNESVNSGLSLASKMKKSGLMFDAPKSNILSGIREKAQDTFNDVKMPEISLDVSSDNADDGDNSFFSLGTLIKFILIVVILWFMWSSLSNNGDFHLGMGEFGDKITQFFKSMEEKGRELISRVTDKKYDNDNDHDHDNDHDANSDSDSDSDGDGERDNDATTAVRRKSSSAPHHHLPTPPGMTNSSDKRPGFINDDTKYTFLDKADRSYSGPAPRADDSTSVTQKHQTGKAGYCYIGEDRGFRSCVKVDASDKCMSGQVFSRQDICVDPTLRE